MKNKLLTGLLCLTTMSVLASAAFAVGGKTSETVYAEGESFATTHMTMEKNEFQVGEPIYVKTTGESDLHARVYLVQKGWENDTAGGTGTAGENVYIRFKYVHSEGNTLGRLNSNGISAGVENAFAWDMRTASYVGNNGKTSLVDVPAGDYEMLYVPNDGWEKAYTEKLAFTVKASGVEDVKAYHISVPKTKYNLGEEITVTIDHYENSTDWVGYAVIDATGSAGYAYCNWSNTYKFTPWRAGTIRLGFVPKDDYFYHMTEMIIIEVVNTEHMVADKTTFAYNESVYVTPTAKNPGEYDWIGISTWDPATCGGSIVWKYIEDVGYWDPTANGLGSGVKVDIAKASSVAKPAEYPFAPGVYGLIFIEKNGGAADACEEIFIDFGTSTEYELKNADLFSDYFIEQIGNVCSAAGDSDVKTLQTNWANVKTAFGYLTAESQRFFKFAVANPTGEKAQKVAALHDYMVTKYGTSVFEDLFGRNVGNVSGSYNAGESFVANNSYLALVAIIGAAAIAGVALTGKKRKQN